MMFGCLGLAVNTGYIPFVSRNYLDVDGLRSVFWWRWFRLGGKDSIPYSELLYGNDSTTIRNRYIRTCISGRRPRQAHLTIFGRREARLLIRFAPCIRYPVRLTDLNGIAFTLYHQNCGRGNVFCVPVAYCLTIQDTPRHRY